MTPLPPVAPWKEIQRRLKLIFPEGSPNRAHSVWSTAAKTIFVMLYTGAVEGRDVWLRPDQVSRMTDVQAGRTGEGSRLAWVKESLRRSKGAIAGRWYAVNSRESIRDDTIRNALIPNAAVVEREGLAVTSSAGKYALKAAFAKLFDPALSETDLAQAVDRWQAENLSAGERVRIALRRRGASSRGEVLVRLPNDDTHPMPVGASSQITKDVVEKFAARFLGQPAVIWISDSRNKVVARYDVLARSINLNIKADRNLPDVILVDLAPKHPLLVFVEVVATDGPVTSERKAVLRHLAEDAGFPAGHVAFVTAYLDRSDKAFKKTVDSLAWGTFAWFASEPENLMLVWEGGKESTKTLAEWG